MHVVDTSDLLCCVKISFILCGVTAQLAGVEMPWMSSVAMFRAKAWNRNAKTSAA